MLILLNEVQSLARQKYSNSINVFVWKVEHAIEKAIDGFCKMAVN